MIFLVSGLHFILTVRIGGDKWLPSSVNVGGAGKIERQLWKCSLVFFARYKRPLQFDKKMSNLLNLLHQNSPELRTGKTFLFTEINTNPLAFLQRQGLTSGSGTSQRSIFRHFYYKKLSFVDFSSCRKDWFRMFFLVIYVGSTLSNCKGLLVSN